MDDARKRQFDAIVVWRFDRFARSTKHRLLALEEFRSLGVQFISYQENMDTSIRGNLLAARIYVLVRGIRRSDTVVILRELQRAGINENDVGRGAGAIRDALLNAKTVAVVNVRAGRTAVGSADSMVLGVVDEGVEAVVGHVAAGIIGVVFRGAAVIVPRILGIARAENYMIQLRGHGSTALLSTSSPGSPPI